MKPRLKFGSTTIIDNSLSPEKLIEIILTNRQVLPTDVADFLKPTPPQLDLELEPALTLLKEAISQDQPILIYGDYDVDGVTSTAILWQSIHKIYPQVTPFIPHRQRDGYGFKAESFLRFQAEKGIKFELLITIDNGIVAEAEFAKIKQQQKLSIIVIDHHLPSANLPQVDAIVHSPQVCAAALGWFFSRQFYPQADLGLAALGTVADCLPLIGVNRAIVVHGLAELRLNPNFGIKKLIELSGIKGDSLSAYDLAFILAPRINAVGRLAEPTDALRLLCSQSPLQATKYASALNSFNQDRQVLQKESLEVADTKVNSQDRLIFISDPEFNPGIIGLIAGRLTEKYYLPSIIIATDGDIAKGSCRSIFELNIVDALREHTDLFIDLGGHAMAAGFSLYTENIPKLKKALLRTISKKLEGLDLQPTLNLDAQMKLSAVNLKNILALKKLEPFGIGNREPLFIFKKLKIVSKKILGSSGDHLKLKLDDPESPKVEYLATDAIAFKKGDLEPTLKIGDLVDVVASLSANTWNGATTPQLIVKEILV